MASDRQLVHHLLDQLEPGQFDAVAHLIEVMADPVARSIANAPVEDEQITDEMSACLDRARASLDRGEGIPHEEILREFGLTPRP